MSARRKAVPISNQELRRTGRRGLLGGNDAREAARRGASAGVAVTCAGACTVFGMIGFLVAGLIIGALARLIKPGKQDLGILATLGLGVVGSLVGGSAASLLGTGDIWELNVLGFVVAVVAAVMLVGVAEAMVGRNHDRV